MLPSRNFRNANNNSTTNNVHSSLLRKKGVFDSIEADKIGEGKYFTEGKYGNRKNLGLKGQLSKLKRAGKNLVTKNLSHKNLDDIYNIISSRLKGHNVGYGVHITRNDKLAMMQKAEKLVRAKGSNFSREDKADLEKIVDVLKQQSKETILNKRYNNSQKDQKSSLLRNKDQNVTANKNLKSPDLYLGNLKNNQGLNNNLDNKPLASKSDKLELEDDFTISKPLESDEEIEDLRNQAKDLAI